MGGSAYDVPATGANPPPGQEWQIGKTAASIAFVGASESYLQGCGDPQVTNALRDAIERVKRGELTLDQALTPEEYLASPR
jgi:hypothetical protein